MQDHRAGKGHSLRTLAKAEDEPYEGVETGRAIRVRHTSGFEVAQCLDCNGAGSLRTLIMCEREDLAMRQSQDEGQGHMLCKLLKQAQHAILHWHCAVFALQHECDISQDHERRAHVHVELVRWVTVLGMWRMPLGYLNTPGGGDKMGRCHI
eukprot:13828923-Heterocapsa_arctica.AAC.1